MPRVLIIGAGLAGLGAAWQLERIGRRRPVHYEILEKESRPGGLARTESAGGFFFDYTGHLLHFRTALFRKLVLCLIGDRLQQRQRSAWVYSKGVYTRYPFQANLFGLPPEVIVECLYEAGRAHFDGQPREIRSFDDWIRTRFGKGIADHFLVPYNSKLYRRHPEELSPDCAGRFLPQTDLRQLLRGAVTDATGALGYNAVFSYPSAGGIEVLVKALASLLKPVRTSEAVVKVFPSARRLITSAGRELHYDTLVCTQPLPLLVRSLEGAPSEVRAAADRLRHVSVLNLNLGVRGDLGPRHWVYVPEPQFPFHRIGFPHNFADSMAPAGCSSLYLEVTYRPEVGVDVQATRVRAIEGLLSMGLLRGEQDIVAEKNIDLHYGYVIFDRDREPALQAIRAYLQPMGIVPAGRFGSWAYSSMEDSFLEGCRAASQALNLGEAEAVLPGARARARARRSVPG